MWVAAAAFTLTLMLPLNNRLGRARSTSSPKQSRPDYKRWSERHLPSLLLPGGGSASPLARKLCLRPSGRDILAAIDGDGGPGHEGRIIACQKCNAFGDLFGLAKTP
jgi:hypothetical protein